MAIPHQIPNKVFNKRLKTFHGIRLRLSKIIDKD